MSNETDEILEDFLLESKKLVDDMNDILDDIEGDMSKAGKLSDVSLYVDRIMGGVKILALDYPAEHMIHKISSYTELCKIIGAKAAKIKDNEQFYDICVAFLADATDMLENMLDSLKNDETDIRVILSETFLKRLEWIKGQFDSREHQALAQNDIDDLLSKLGIG